MIPRPGEVSLAHNGVLFLDELPEFPRNLLEVMRQPLEDGTVRIARASMSLIFPARFMLAAAMNPCPGGFFNDKSRECRCTQPMIPRYMQKISGPLMDRIDIHIDVPAVNYKEMRSVSEPEGSVAIRRRVLRARETQLQRFAPSTRHPIYSNAQMTSRHNPDVLRIIYGLQRVAGKRHEPAGPDRPAARPYPQSRAYGCRFGGVAGY